MIGEAAAAGRKAKLGDLRVPPHDGITGPRKEGSIGFSVIRGGGIIGDHDAQFISDEEILSINHRALDRAIFAKGALAAAIEPSPWLVGFSLFVFLSLAALKRYAELVRSAYEQLPGRAYRRDDRAIVAAFGIAAAVAATVVLALYVNGADVTRLYLRPQVLWALGPIVLTWLARMWTLAHRGGMPGDPVLYALRDAGSWLSALALLACVWLAT